MSSKWCLDWTIIFVSCKRNSQISIRIREICSLLAGRIVSVGATIEIDIHMQSRSAKIWLHAWNPSCRSGNADVMPLCKRNDRESRNRQDKISYHVLFSIFNIWRARKLQLRWFLCIFLLSSTGTWLQFRFSHSYLNSWLRI